MTEELFITLSKLPQLEALSLTNWYHEFSPVDEDMGKLRKLKVVDDEDARRNVPFHSLTKTDIFHSGFVITDIFQCTIPLLNLVDLTYSASSPDHNVSAPFFESLHRTCPNLKKISIFSYAGLPFQVIWSLLKCPALVEIISSGDIDLSSPQLATIATNRSSWRVLNLPSLNPFNYQALVPFAQNCPNLHELMLMLDSMLGILDLDTFTKDIKFSSLTLLVVIALESAPDLKAALFLSKICSKPVRIISDDNPWWTSVEKLVNSIITSQCKIRTLEDDNMPKIQFLLPLYVFPTSHQSPPPRNAILD